MYAVEKLQTTSAARIPHSQTVTSDFRLCSSTSGPDPLKDPTLAVTSVKNGNKQSTGNGLNRIE